MRLSISDLSYITVSKLLQITGQICAFDGHLFITLVWGETIKSRPGKLVSRKYRLIVCCKILFDNWRGSRVWRTDRTRFSNSVV